MLAPSNSAANSLRTEKLPEKLPTVTSDLVPDKTDRIINYSRVITISLMSDGENIVASRGEKQWDYHKVLSIPYEGGSGADFAALNLHTGEIYSGSPSKFFSSHSCLRSVSTEEFEMMGIIREEGKLLAGRAIGTYFTRPGEESRTEHDILVGATIADTTPAA